MKGTFSNRLTGALDQPYVYCNLVEILEILDDQAIQANAPLNETNDFVVFAKHVQIRSFTRQTGYQMKETSFSTSPSFSRNRSDFRQSHCRRFVLLSVVVSHSTLKADQISSRVTKKFYLLDRIKTEFVQVHQNLPLIPFYPQGMNVLQQKTV